MLPLPMSYECPTCNRVFVSWRSLDSHLRLDHPADDDAPLTVAEILAAPHEEPPAERRETEQRVRATGEPLLERAEAFAAQPWIAATVAWLWLLYGLSHLGLAVGHLLLLSLVGAVVVAVLAVRAWGRSELRLQEDIRRRNPPLT